MNAVNLNDFDRLLRVPPSRLFDGHSKPCPGPTQEAFCNNPVGPRARSHTAANSDENHCVGCYQS